MIAWAVKKAGVDHVTLDGVDTTDPDMDPSGWNPVILGDLAFRITAHTGTISN